MRKSNKNKLGFMLVALSTFLLLTGCGSGEAESNPDPQTETSVNEDLNEGDSSNENSTEANQEKPLTVYLNDFGEVIGDLFEEKTGYEIDIVDGGGAEILAKIEAERANPHWDVVFLDGYASVNRLANEGLLLEGWEPENLSHLSDYGKQFVPDHLGYFPLTVHASAVIVYNHDMISAEEAPQSWEEFFAFDGPIGMADPGVAAPAYPVVSWMFHKYGTSEMQDTFQSMFSKQLNVYPKNNPLASALINGDIHVAALQETNAHSSILDGEPLSLVWPSDGVPGSMRVAGINKDSSEIEVAKAFIEFMLEPETQAYLTDIEASHRFFTPLVEGVQPNSDRTQVDEFMIELPPAEWASENEEMIKNWFADQAVQ